MSLNLKPSSCEGCPLYEAPHGSKFGYLSADGEFNKNVLIVGEAAGEQEEAAGKAFIGRSGSYLWTNLKRVGLVRDDFRIFNVLACRPPNNKLAGMPYEAACIKHCAPNLDEVIRFSREEAHKKGKTLAILTLGRTAFKRVLGLDDELHSRMLKLDYLCYPFWSKQYGAWVVAADHPSYLMRGNHHLISILQYAALRAVDIAENGLELQQDNYLLDPDAPTFTSWVDGYLRVLEQAPQTVLAYDIETLVKQGADEEEVAREEDSDYTILRISFSYKPGTAVTVPWRAEYMTQIRRIFASDGPKVGWNNENYDNPRIQRHMPICGDNIDAMLGWHVLNSALPKGLGFVTPFYAKRSTMWKHESEAKPDFYSAKDSDMQLQCWLGIQQDLIKAGLWTVFESHVIKLNRVFGYMREQGVLRDEELRKDAEIRIKTVLTDIQKVMDETVPFEAKSCKIYLKTPKDTTGLVKVPGVRKTKKCSICGALDIKATHIKSIGKKRLKAGDTENPCLSASIQKVTVSSELWAQVLPFKLSTKSLLQYQGVKKHSPVMDPKKRRPIFDEKAIMRLHKKYKDDTLYPQIVRYRKHQKLLGTYIGVTDPITGIVEGGLPVGPDGLIHTHFTHNPSTLRSASQRPNLQNLPRPSKDKTDPGNIIRNLIVARPGHIFLARDFSGIEAVLVGYFAQDPGYIRLAKKDVHSFYTAYALHELDGRISANDLPQLSWEDDKLFARLAEIKKEFSEDRNSLYKHLVHGANFMQGPRGAAEKILAETEIEYPTALVKRVMDIYFELFPKIRTWHKTLLAQADRDGFVRNPFGYVHRFYRVFEWEKIGDQWQREQGPDANKVIAFGPQSTAAGIIKEAMLRLYLNRFDEAGQYLRLLIHDELFCEVPEADVHEIDAVLKVEMEQPVKCMPLPPEWKMGEYLFINTEEKMGKRWGEMK